jgi:hypothetical protein
MCPFIKVFASLLLLWCRVIIVVMIAHLFIFFEAGFTHLLLRDPPSRLFILAVSHTGPDIDIELI